MDNQTSNSKVGISQMVNIRFIHCICLDTSGSVLEVTAPLENQTSNIKTEDGYGYHEKDNQE